MCYLDKNKPINSHFTRDLPHWHQDDVFQFVTFRLADSLPQSKINEISELKAQFISQHPQPWTDNVKNEYWKLIGPIENKLLDVGYGSCVLKFKPVQDILAKSIMHFNNIRYEVHAYVIMPNHVHLLLKLKDGNLIDDVLQSIKSYSSLQINKILKRTGKLWLKENWDRIVRSEKHLMHCIQYIRENPQYLEVGEYVLYVTEDMTTGTELTAGCGPSIWSKMTGGEVYDATHPELVKRLEATREKIWEFNQLRPSQLKEQHKILDSLLGDHGEHYHFNQPFRCDYGCNVFIGENFFANFNLTILDEAEVRMGDNCFIGPNVSIYTACHPLDAETRNTCVEWAEPVRIGDNVWIGGSATILPGVTIGNNVVIGAGAVVTKSFGDNVVIGGNPAKVIKRIPPKDGHQQLGPDSCGE